MKKILLSVAGYDPTAGAGIHLDLEVFSHLGFHGMGILTSLTSQNTKHVKKVQCIQPGLIWDQYETLSEDVSFSGIKVGMVGCKNNIQVIRKILSENPNIPKVIDPVFQSSSAAQLLEKGAIPDYIKKIVPQASLLTPNIEEAERISGIEIQKPEDMKKAAERIYTLSRAPCLIKGGHLKDPVVDMLFDGDNFHFFKKEKLQKNVHGTGCFLSACLLGYLVRGNPLKKATLHATNLTYEAIKSAISLGHGQDIITFSNLKF